MSKMNDEEATSLLKYVLKKMEEEGQLRKMIQVMTMDDPKSFMLKMSDVGNFQMAKFGGLQKAANYFKEGFDKKSSSTE
jgi:hypothetical protein